MSLLTILTNQLIKNHPKLKDDSDFEAFVELCQSSYMQGKISTAKELAVWRDGKQVIGILEEPLEDYIKKLEEKFGLKYKTYLDRRLKLKGDDRQAEE